MLNGDDKHFARTMALQTAFFFRFPVFLLLASRLLVSLPWISLSKMLIFVLGQLHRQLDFRKHGKSLELEQFRPVFPLPFRLLRSPQIPGSRRHDHKLFQPSKGAQLVQTLGNQELKSLVHSLVTTLQLERL